MTNTDRIQEYANLIIQLVNEVRDIADVMADLEIRLERIEKVMD